MRPSLVLGLVLLSASLEAQAALIGRLPLTPGGVDYQAYFDTDLNITWQANANLAVTETFGVESIADDGRMTWYTAMDWIDAMNAASYLGYNDWRLPVTTQPDPSCPAQYDPGGGLPIQGFGPGCAGSEMGHLFNMENITYYAPSPFGNLFGAYWSETDLAYKPAYAIHFTFGIGDQIGEQKNLQGNWAWAVRSGDVAIIPIPAAAWMLASAFAILATVRRRAIPASE